MYDEKRLIEQCLSGDRKAEKQLYDTYSALFFGICLRYTDKREEAEDMLITGFTQIFLHLSEYQAKGSFEGWMKRIVIHNAIDYVRKRKYDGEAWEDIPESDSPSHNATMHRMEAADVMQAIQSLPPLLRTIFNLYAVEGYAHREIAQLLEMNESTVRAYFSKAKKQLQELLSEYR